MKRGKPGGFFDLSGAKKRIRSALPRNGVEMREADPIYPACGKPRIIHIIRYWACYELVNGIRYMKKKRILLRCLPIIATILLSGCTANRSIVKQPRRIFGISIQLPSTRKVYFFERSCVYYIYPKDSIRKTNSELIMILPYSKSNDKSESEWELVLQETLRKDIRRIKDFLIRNSMESRITINYIPLNTEVKIKKVILVIPANYFSEESDMNIMGERRFDVFPIIDIYAIWTEKQIVVIDVYKGKRENINLESDEIMFSMYK